MTSAQRIPVIPDPESDKVLFEMLVLILRHPSCLHVHFMEFEKSYAKQLINICTFFN